MGEQEDLPFLADEVPPTTRSPETLKRPKARGFAVMKARGDDIRAIASKGGKAAHAAGTAHQFTPEEAREAGRKGGVAPHVSRGKQPRR